MKKFWPLILIVLFLIPAIKALFGPGYFNMHDDLQVMRIFEMEKCFADGQIPCRWATDMAYGYGQAMFNYYSALPYYLGVLLRILTPLSLMATVKLLFMISLVAGAFGMYGLAKEFWGKAGGVMAGVLYTLAPYHGVDVYVRGALAESFSLAILPFLWWSLYLLIKNPNFKKVAATSLLTAALLTTHNISTMIYVPFSLLWTLFWLVKFKTWKKALAGLAGSAALGVGLAAFFIIPAIFEQGLIQTQHLISEYSDYHGHFVTLRQLFISRFWGDGPSIFGEGDGMSFQVGWPHWWLGILTAPLALFWLKDKKNRGKGILLGCLLGLFLLVTFLTHPRSFLIWEAIAPMAFIQFPWRFLGLSMFFLAFSCGALAYNPRANRILLPAVIILVVALNANYFIPVHFSSKVRDSEKLTGLAFELQQKSAILDYLPKTAKAAPPSLAFESPRTVSGNGDFFGFSKGSDRFSFEAQIYGKAMVEIPVTYFPGWILLVDGKKVPIALHETYGFIMVDLGDGRHIVRGRFTNTPIRTFANVLSALSLLGLLGATLIWENKKIKK